MKFMIVGLLSAALIAPPKISSTSELIEAMQRQYQGKWATTVTFTQQNIHYAADTIKSRSTWYEAIEYPNNFRIDLGFPREGNAIIFANDSVYSFKEGALQSRRFRLNYLILLNGGIYFLPKAEALKRLKEAGYNTDVFREDVWEGRKVYVIGAAKGDEKTAQCWIDAQRMYLVRTINPTPDGRLQDARFGKHVRLGGGWIETEVLFLKDGKREQLEEYQNTKANVTLPAGLFDPAQFGKVHWMHP